MHEKRDALYLPERGRNKSITHYCLSANLIYPIQTSDQVSDAPYYIVKINERHYKNVEANDITAEDLNGYQIHVNE